MMRTRRGLQVVSKQGQSSPAARQSHHAKARFEKIQSD
jgi:hypothetical protein